MFVMNYMERQIKRVRDKHDGETFLRVCGETTRVEARPVREILREIDGLQGLNVRERLSRAKEAVKA